MALAHFPAYFVLSLCLISAISKGAFAVEGFRAKIGVWNAQGPTTVSVTLPRFRERILKDEFVSVDNLPADLAPEAEF